MSNRRKLRPPAPVAVIEPATGPEVRDCPKCGPSWDGEVGVLGCCSVSTGSCFCGLGWYIDGPEAGRSWSEEALGYEAPSDHICGAR